MTHMPGIPITRTSDALRLTPILTRAATGRTTTHALCCPLDSGSASSTRPTAYKSFGTKRFSLKTRGAISKHPSAPISRPATAYCAATIWAEAIVLQGLETSSRSPASLEQRLLIALEEGDATAAKEMLIKLPPSRDAIFGRLQVYANTGDWAGIDELADQTDISQFAEDDRAFFESLSLLSRCKLNTIADPRTAIRDLLSKVSGSGRCADRATRSRSSDERSDLGPAT